jgi:hypothetical protein
MLHRSLWSLYAFLILPAGSFAQTVDASAQLRRFGHKMVEGTWVQTDPVNQASRHTYKWALGNQYLLRHEKNAAGPNALSVGGIDPSSGLQTWWTFSEDGTISITSIEVETVSPTKDKLKLAGPRPAGTGSFDVVWPDPDTILIEPGPDAPAPDGSNLPQVRWQRSAEVDDLAWLDADPPTEIPPVFESTKFLTGQRWIDGVSPEGTKIAGGSFGRWVLDGKFFLFAGSTAGDDQTTWSHLLVMGTDPKTRKPATWEFTSNGAKSDVTYRPDGKAITGVNSRTNGETYCFEGAFTIDGDVLRYKSEIGKKGENPLPYQWNYRPAK